MARKRRRFAAVIILVTAFAFAACRGPEVSPEEWREMTRAEKVLLVESLIGRDLATARKEGRAYRPPGSAEALVDAIDRRYASGETRPVEEVWDAMTAETAAPPEGDAS